MSHILIIEDIEDIGNSLCDFASVAGMPSRYYAEFSRVPVTDLDNASHIILDLNMPGLDGLDVLEELGKYKVKVPIILCSGVSDDVIESAADVLKALGLVYGGKLPKPFTYAQFLTAIETPQIESCLQAKVSVAPEASTLTRSELEQAIEKNWFYSVFQPQIDVNNGRVFGVECLARLAHPSIASCGPDEFIAKLVEFDLIDVFTEKFLIQALRELQAAGYPKTKRIAFNIDPSSLCKEFLSKLCELVLESDFPASQICFEITELFEVDLTNEIKSALTKLRIHGIHVSLDDFGTGFSTIHELDQLPFSELKIDRAFVSQITNRTGTLSIVKHTIALAKELNMLVVAEGIETEEQIALLQSMDCQYMQGYYFSKPLEIDALMAFMSELDVKEFKNA